MSYAPGAGVVGHQKVAKNRSWGIELRSLQEWYALLTMELFLQSQNSPFKNSSYIKDRKYKKQT